MVDIKRSVQNNTDILLVRVSLYVACRPYVETIKKVTAFKSEKAFHWVLFVDIPKKKDGKSTQF